MAWLGPYEDGITQSLINKFLECPYRFYVYAIEGLQEVRILEPNLIWGDTFHKGLEHLISYNYRSKDFSQETWKVIDGYVENHLYKNYPSAPDTFLPSIKEMLRLYDDSFKDSDIFETERKFCVSYKTIFGRTVKLRGKLDAINLCRTTLIEHKCKGRTNKQQDRAEIPLDLQVNLYAHITGVKRVIYDIIRIPDTGFFIPPRKSNQRPSNYVKGLYHDNYWGDFPVAIKRSLWIDQFTIPINQDKLRTYRYFTIDPLIEKVCKWWEHVNQPGFDPEDPGCYNEIFYRTPIRHFDPSATEKYKCSYFNYLTGTIQKEDLIPVKTYFPELEEKKE